MDLGLPGRRPVFLQHVLLFSCFTLRLLWQITGTCTQSWCDILSQASRPSDGSVLGKRWCSLLRLLPLKPAPKALRCSCRHSSDQDQNKSFMADKGDHGFTSPDFLSPKLQSFLSRTRVNSLHEGANNLSLLREGCSKDRFPHSYSSHYLLSLPQGAQRN